MEDRPFVPLIDRGVLEGSDSSCVGGVVVPLMLARHVAELPDPGSFPDAVERLRSDVARYLEHGERQYPYVTGQTKRGDVLGVILYPALRAAEIIGLAPDLEGTTRMTLSPNGVHLFHGFLVFVVHSLAPAVSAARSYEGTQGDLTNSDVAVVRERLLAMVDEGDEGQALETFSVKVVDTFGRPVVLRAVWYPNRGLASWEWEGVEGEPTGGIFFDLEQAALLAGFFTLLRLAYPDQWSWQEK